MIYVGVQQETKKFREEILRKLSKDEEAFGDDLEMIVNVCAEVNHITDFEIWRLFILTICDEICFQLRNLNR